MKAFPAILSPLSIGPITLPNRMIMGAMHTRLETLDRPHERLAAFYARRAAGEIGLILTGGYSPVPEGVMDEGGPLLNRIDQLEEHRSITSSIHEAGGRVVLQILHAGRYARVPECVSPSPGKARINRYSPRPLTTEAVWATIESFADTAALAREAGYDGIEIMGSEGYLINEFTAALTNHRDDEFGVTFEGRTRFPLEIIKAVRTRVGPDFLIIYRISSIDLMEGGMPGHEVAQLARLVEQAGANVINTGIGWHESAIPTIAASVPRAAWLDAIRNIKQAVTIPVIASNRINMPDVAEAIVSAGIADLVSMARPLLADPDFARKTRLGAVDEINTCIACNQACLDRIFTDRSATCLVNPRAGREIEFPDTKAAKPQHFAVVGGGPAGMAFAINAAQRGHQVSLFEAASELGGQLNLAKKVPGKNEFNEMLRYFKTALQLAGVTTHLNEQVTARRLTQGNFDAVILATGVTPRIPDIKGMDHPKVVSYYDVLAHGAPVGQQVAIIGAGGIGFDVAEYLLGDEQASTDPARFLRSWGVDRALASPGGLTTPDPAPAGSRQVYMLQRKPESPGRTLGKSTGWILKTKLRNAGVKMIAGVSYDSINAEGLHFTVDGERQILKVDTVIVCAGQTSNRQLHQQLGDCGMPVYLIGGADVAGELDAQRAIDQATRLAVQL